MKPLSSVCLSLLDMESVPVNGDSVVSVKASLSFRSFCLSVRDLRFRLAASPLSRCDVILSSGSPLFDDDDDDDTRVNTPSRAEPMYSTVHTLHSL